MFLSTLYRTLCFNYFFYLSTDTYTLLPQHTSSFPHTIFASVQIQSEIKFVYILELIQFSHWSVC